MSIARYYVVAPRDVGRCVAQLSLGELESLEWSYFGSDMHLRDRVALALPRISRIPISDELAEAGRTLRKPFLDWVVELGKKQRDPLTWWSSRLGSKDILQTDFFHLLTYRVLFESWVKKVSGTQMRLVVVEDPWLRWLLERDFSKQARFFGSARSAVVINAVAWLLQIPASIGYAIGRHAWRKVVATKHLPKRAPKGSEEHDPEVLLFTWVEAACFRNEGRFQDVYTGRLGELLANTGRRVARFVPVTTRANQFRALRPFADQFVPAIRYATLLDILRASFWLFRIDGIQTTPPIAGVDCRVLLRREFLREQGRPAAAGCKVSYLALRRMARAYGKSLRHVVYTFENQMWEKMLCRAFRDELPEVQIIGYLHSSSAPFNFYFGEGEVEFSPLPDHLATHGAPMVEILRQRGFPEKKLVNAGAIRFENLFRTQPTLEQDVGVSVHDERRIVVALSVVAALGAPLLTSLLETFSEPFLDEQKRVRVRFVVKCHPQVPLEKLGRKVSDFPAWFEQSTKPLSDLLPSFHLLLFAPPTTAWRDALLAGVPYMKFRDDVLDLEEPNLLKADDFPVCGSTTLKQRIAEAVANGLGRPQAPRAELLATLFSPVNESLWGELLGTAKVSQTGGAA